MYKKYKINGTLKVMTGLHIGGSTQYSPIGSVDAPVIRNILTNQPIIPGSSLKGKMRTLLARYITSENILPKPNKDNLQIRQLFGQSKDSEDKSDSNPILKARLQFGDMDVKNGKELRDELFLDSLTEIKFENTIDRFTAGAKPRQIERVVPGVEFKLNIMYDAVFDKDDEVETAIESDFKLLGIGFELLQLDYLGGNGTRGYGRVKFEDVNVSCVFGKDKEEEKNFEDKLTDILKSYISQAGENNDI